MFDPWTPLVLLAATLLALLFVKRWITRSLQEVSIRWVGDPDVALVIYFVLVLPGVVIHELSHWLMAKLLGVRVSRPRSVRCAKGGADGCRWARCGWARSTRCGPASLGLPLCWAARP